MFIVPERSIPNDPVGIIIDVILYTMELKVFMKPTNLYWTTVICYG